MNDEVCPNCNKEIGRFDKKSVLNIFNIGKPNYRERNFYCSDTCIESKIRNSNNEAKEYFPVIIPEKVIVAFMKSKTGEYTVIVDL